MAEIVTMGEIMLRLSPPEHQRFIQATSFDINYGGSEGNIAVCLSNYGHNVGYITKLPKNEIGECVIATLQKYGVNYKRWKQVRNIFFRKWFFCKTIKCYI